ARVWDCQAGTYATPVLEHPLPVRTLAFNPGGERLATGCLDHQARVFAVPAGAEKPLFEAVPHFQSAGNLIAPVFVAEGRGLLTVPASYNGGDRRVIWRNAESGAFEYGFKYQGGRGISAVAISPGGRYFAIGGYGGAQIWEVAREGRGGSLVSPWLQT